MWKQIICVPWIKSELNVTWPSIFPCCFASSSLWGKSQCQQAPDQQPWVGLCWERWDQRGEEWRPGGFDAVLKHTYSPVGSQVSPTGPHNNTMSVHCTDFLQGYFPLSLPRLFSTYSICTVPIFCIYILLPVSTSLLCATLTLVPQPSTCNQCLWKESISSTLYLCNFPVALIYLHFLFTSSAFFRSFTCKHSYEYDMSNVLMYYKALHAYWLSRLGAAWHPLIMEWPLQGRGDIL